MATKNDSELISRARTRLLLDQPWFGSLALRLKVEAHEDGWFTSKGLPVTAAVDGVTLHYSPKFWASMSDAEQKGVMAHEVMHCALLHMTRRGKRDPQIWNEACDYVVNLELVNARSAFSLPKDCLLDKRFAGMSAEQVYAKLLEQGRMSGKAPKYIDFGHVMDAPKGSKGGLTEGKGDKPEPGKGTGDQPAEGNDIGDVETAWKIAVEQATMTAKKAGKLPGCIEAVLEATRKRGADWRDVLRRYLTTNGDYSWTMPNRRFISRGLYLPGTVKSRLTTMVIAIDTSGSVSDKLLQEFAAEVNSILSNDERPERTMVIYCDARVNRVDEVEGELKLHAVGRGGTAFKPVFDYIEENGIIPDCMFYLTDLEGDDPKAPDYPVLWLVPESCRLQGKFGETVNVHMDE